MEINNNKFIYTYLHLISRFLKACIINKNIWYPNIEIRKLIKDFFKDKLDACDNPMKIYVYNAAIQLHAFEFFDKVMGLTVLLDRWRSSFPGAYVFFI
jgi:hypothetical protein